MYVGIKEENQHSEYICSEISWSYAIQSYFFRTIFILIDYSVNDRAKYDFWFPKINWEFVDKINNFGTHAGKLVWSPVAAV